LSLVRSVGEVVVSRGNIRVGSSGDREWVNLALGWGSVQLGTVVNVVVGSIAIVSLEVNTAGEVRRAGESKLHGHILIVEDKVAILEHLGEIFHLAILESRDQIVSGGKLPSFSVIGVVGGVEVRSAELYMQKRVSSHCNLGRVEVILNSRVALNDVSSSSSIVQVDNSSTISVGKLFKLDDIRSVLEGSGNLISLQSDSKSKCICVSRNLNIGSFKEWNISCRLVKDVLAVRRNIGIDSSGFSQLVSVCRAVEARVPEDLFSGCLTCIFLESRIVPVRLRIIRRGNVVSQSKDT